MTHRFDPTVRVFDDIALVPIETFPYARKEFPEFVKSTVFDVELPNPVTSESFN